MTAKKVGRPTRAESIRRLVADSPDLSPADVRRLLGALAIDANTPAHARVASLRALLNAEASPEGEQRGIEWADHAPE